MVRLCSRKIRGVCVAFIPVALAACASTPEPIIGLAEARPVAEFGQSDYSQARSNTYLLRPSDRVSISVFREPDFTLENVRLGVEGSVSIPMLGSIPAMGLTTKQFEEDLTKRLSAVGLRNPLVSVNIVEYASHLVTVEGAVARPGVYPFQPGARLSAAIALASGPTPTAKRDQIAVFRDTPEGIMIAKFDYRAMSSGTMLDPVLEPGDRVVMGTDGLAVFYQDLLKTVPAIGAFVLAGTRVQ